MTREEAIKAIKSHCYFANLVPIGKEALDMAIKALEQQPCEDAISREAALEAILIRLPDFSGDEGGNLVDRDEAASAIRNLPSATPKQKAGKWNVLGRDDPDCLFYRCSECHTKITLKFNYCPFCGAKMDSEE